MLKNKQIFNLSLLLILIAHTSNLLGQTMIEHKTRWGYHLGLGHTIMSFNNPVDNYEIANNGLGFIVGMNLTTKLNSRSSVYFDTGIMMSNSKIINLNDETEAAGGAAFIYLNPDYSLKITNTINNNLYIHLGVKGDFEISNKIIYLGGGIGLEMLHKLPFFSLSYIVKYYYSKSVLGDLFGEPTSINGISLTFNFM